MAGVVSSGVFPCSGCSRHLRSDETLCPFCGAAQQSISAEPVTGGARALAFTVALLGVAACTPETVNADGGGSASAGTSTSTGESAATTASTETETSTETDAGDAADDSNNTSGSFYAGADDDPEPVEDECDILEQDCPEGEKCVPFDALFMVDTNICVMVLGEGAPGELCTTTSSGEEDDCDATSYCWNVHGESERGLGLGYCMAFCTGDADDPQCSEGTSCMSLDQGTMQLCTDDCDPLAQDCDEGTLCTWFQDRFRCIFATEETNALAEPCNFVNDCEPGTQCFDGNFVAGCNVEEGTGFCCAAYCDLEDPEACPDPEAACLPFFDVDEGYSVEGFETLGVCLTGEPPAPGTMAP